MRRPALRLLVWAVLVTALASAWSLGAPAPAEAARAKAAAKRMVSIARGELARGVREVPDGSNRGERIRMYGRSTTPRFYPAPWCAYFVSWVARRAGRPLGPSGRGFGYVPYIRAWALRAKKWRRKPRAGDLVMFPQHVGLVETVYANGTLTTIEGNSSNRVARRWRRWGEASGYVRVASGGGVVRRPPVRPRPPRVRQPLVPRISVYPSRVVASGQRVGFSANDSSGDIVRYRWDLDGDGRFDDARGDNAERVYTRPGVVRVGLRITDRRRRTRATRVALTVRPNQAPTARLILPREAPLGATVRGHAEESSDPDGRIVRYEWDMDGDGQWEAGGDHHEMTYARPGIYTVGLRVVDDGGAMAETVRTIRISHRSPVARASGPRSAWLGRPVAFDGSRSSDPDGRVASWRWDFDGDGITDAEGATPTWTFSAPGPRRVRLVVADEWGAEASTQLSLDVRNRAPEALITLPERPVAGVDLRFDAARSSDPDGAIARYDWDFDNDWRWDATGVEAAWRYARGGDRKVRLRVTDEWGATRTVYRWIHVLEPPRARLSVLTDPPVAGSPVGFSAGQSSDPDGSIVRLEWDLDGDATADVVTTKRSTTVTWTYAEPGEYPASVTVTDDDGLSATAAVTVVVR